MTDRVVESSPRSRARTTGVVYLIYFLTAICGQLLLNRGFARFGFGVSLFSTACYAVLTLLFYFLFKPVNRNVSLIAAVISLAGCIITALGQVHLSAGHISPLALFGPYCLLLGYLIFRSAFLPRVLGVLMILAGLGWLIALRMPDGSHLLPYVEGLGILAEGLLMLWLLVLGVNEKRWQALQASAHRGSGA